MHRPCLLILAGGLLQAGCSPSAGPAGTSPLKATRPADSIEIPLVRGPIALHVTYPAQDGTIDARDSTFLLGTTGTGEATLAINGHPVRVLPNGAWIAWVPLPPDSLLRFELVARTATDSAMLVLTARRARTMLDGPALVLDPASFGPSGSAWLPRSEPVSLSVMASPGAQATLVLPSGQRLPMVEQGAADDVSYGIRAFDSDTVNYRRRSAGSTYVIAVPAGMLGGSVQPLLGAPPVAGNGIVLELVRGVDTLTTPWPLALALLDSEAVVVRLDDDRVHSGLTDSTTVGRTVPGGTYYWFFRTGTQAAATGRINNALRLALSEGTTAWVSADDARALPPGTPAPVARMGSLVTRATPQGELLRIPLRARVPVGVAETRKSITVTLHGARADADWTRYRPGDERLVQRVGWAQDEDRVVITLETSPLWGYRTRWEGTDLIVEVRAAPRIDREHPLRGRRIAVDPGHPPAGTTGPGGYREAEANLAVSLRLADMLRREGAEVILTRTADTPIDLGPRIAMAEQAGAELLVSIHNNAFPDGVNPFTNNGTSVFYNHAQSLDLARAVQRSLVQQLRLRDLGVARGDLALVRPTWQPSILAEGFHLIMPEQEAALRTEAGQARYARGVLEGIRAFLSQWASECEIRGC